MIGAAIPNKAMFSGYAFAPGHAVMPMDIRSTMLANIEVDTGARKRPLDREYIEALKQSIRAQGLLQPIGLKSGGPAKESVSSGASIGSSLCAS